MSGVATVVRGILDGCAASPWQFRTVIIGKSDRLSRGILWAFAQILAPLRFLTVAIYERPGIIHINGPLNPLAIGRDLVLLTLAKPFGAGLIYHLHGGAYVSHLPPSRLLRRMIISLLKRPDVILVLGEREASSISLLYKVDSKKVIVLPNAVTIPEDRPVRQPSGPLRVLSLGRLSSEKGLEVLCEAVEQNASLREEIHLRVYGAGPLQDVLVSRFDAALGSRFEFGGVIGPAERDTAFRWADVLVMPSLHGEGLPMVLLEAMSAGVVPVATPDGMITDVLKDNITGFLIAKGSASAITDGLRRAKAARDEGRLEEMSGLAGALIAERHSLQTYVSELLKVYVRLYVNC